jgi:hypothetical protein
VTDASPLQLSPAQSRERSDPSRSARPPQPSAPAATPLAQSAASVRLQASRLQASRAATIRPRAVRGGPDAHRSSLALGDMNRSPTMQLEAEAITERDDGLAR